MAKNKSFIRVRNVLKSFPQQGAEVFLPVLDGVTFDVEEGAIITTFFGPNACGKTTLLNIMAGLLEPDHGTVQIDGCGPKEISVGYIFQNYRESLFPWRRAIDNIALPLEVAGFSRRARHLRVRELLGDLGVQIPVDRYPYQLSGGQQQLVAIARALVNKPKVLFLDEPFSALDYKTRRAMQSSVLELLRKVNVITVFVSHDVDEAIYLGDTLILFSNKPTKVLQQFEIHLPYPRPYEVFTTEQFTGYKREILNQFKGVLEK